MKNGTENITKRTHIIRALKSIKNNKIRGENFVRAEKIRVCDHIKTSSLLIIEQNVSLQISDFSLI